MPETHAHICLRIAATSLVISLGACGNGVSIPEQTIGGKDVAEILTFVESALQAAQADLSQQNLKVTSADVTLKLVRGRTSSGGLGFLVLSGKVSESSGDSTVLRVSFREPERNLGLVPGPANAAKLQEAIVLAADAAREAVNFNIAKLPFSAVEVAVGFTLTTTGSAGLEIEVSGLTVGGTTEAASTLEHTITLKFEQMESRAE